MLEQVISFTQIQLEEAMKPFRLEGHFPDQSHIPERAPVLLDTGIPHIVVSGSEKSTIPINVPGSISSLLAGEKIQFGVFHFLNSKVWCCSFCYFSVMLRISLQLNHLCVRDAFSSFTLGRCSHLLATYSIEFSVVSSFKCPNDGTQVRDNSCFTLS